MSAGVLGVVSFQLHMLHNYMYIFNMVHLHRHLYQIREHPLSIANLLYGHYRKHFGNPGVGSSGTYFCSTGERGSAGLAQSWERKLHLDKKLNLQRTEMWELLP